MRIVIRVAMASGWNTYFGEVPEGSDIECYALPKVNGEHQCRARFWSEKMGRTIPRGRAMVWHKTETSPPPQPL